MMADIKFSFFCVVILTTCLGGISCTSEEIADENLKKLVAANNELAFKMLRQLASQSSENIFFSPLSLSIAFGMLHYGTKGKTAKELGQAFGYDAVGLPEEFVHSTFQHYLIETLPSLDPHAYALNSANTAILNKNLDVYSSYVKDIRDHYQATVKQVDFTTSNQEVVQDVNNWIKNKTNGKFVKTLHKLDPSTVFVLLNVIYFKGPLDNIFEWYFSFPSKFFNKGLESEAKEVRMMNGLGRFLCTTNREDKFEAIEVPYEGKNISMVIYLPHERDGLGALVKEISLETLKDIRCKPLKKILNLALPRFKLEFSKEMSGDFIALGVQSIFSPGADFSGMSKSKNIYVSQALHKAVIEVYENDTEAADREQYEKWLSTRGVRANRGRERRRLPRYPWIFVDHPFVFSIVDNRNDMILFLGLVTNL